LYSAAAQQGQNLLKARLIIPVRATDFTPKIVCFNGKEAALKYFELKNTGQLNLGLQDKTIGNTRVFVAPSTSALATAHWDEKIWLELRTIISL